MNESAREHNRSIYAIALGFRCESCDEYIDDGQEWLRKTDVIWHVYCAKCAETGDEAP